MIRTREHLAWHVAGHAYAATMCGFPVHKLSLDGFSEADLADRGEAQCLDPCTMIRIPAWAEQPVLSNFENGRQALLSIAIAGPSVELLHRRIPCVIQNVEQFTDDWTQALNVAESLWPDEKVRRFCLERWVRGSLAVLFSGSFYDDVVPQLLDRGVMTGSEVQAAWERMKGRQADYKKKLARNRVQTNSIHALPECLDDDFMQPEENSV